MCNMISADQDYGKPAILIMDSDAATLATCASLLRDRGFPVYPATTEEIFAERLREISPGIIIVKTYAGAPATARIMHEISTHHHCRHIPVICYFADEDIYLLRRKIEDGRMEYRSFRSDNMDTMLQTAIS